MTKVTHLTLDEGGGLSQRRIHLREISGEADTPLETVGQDLRAARLRRGDDLASASKALKIRKDHLEALEEDRLDALPGRTYAIGFVRSYADYLGLDAVDAVERFKQEIAGRDESPKAATTFQAHDEERRLPNGWIVIAVVVLALVIYGAYRLARSADTLLNEPVAPVPARMVAPGPGATGTPSQPSEGTQPSGAGRTGATAPVGSGTAGAPGEQAKVNPPKAAVASIPEASSAPQGAVPAAHGHVYGMRNTESRVILRALTATRVLVEGPQRKVYINRTLAAGDSYRVPDYVGLKLTTSNAGALQIELDGQDMGTAGRKKQVAEALSLNPQAIVDRYNGRRSH